MTHSFAVSHLHFIYILTHLAKQRPTQTHLKTPSESKLRCVAQQRHCPLSPGDSLLTEGCTPSSDDHHGLHKRSKTGFKVLSQH